MLLYLSYNWSSVSSANVLSAVNCGSIWGSGFPQTHSSYWPHSVPRCCKLKSPTLSMTVGRVVLSAPTKWCQVSVQGSSPSQQCQILLTPWLTLTLLYNQTEKTLCLYRAPVFMSGLLCLHQGSQDNHCFLKAIVLQNIK